MKKIISILLIVWQVSGPVAAQEIKGNKVPTIAPASGLFFKFNESGSQYLRMNIWMQAWLRAIDNNPGTAVNGDPQPWTLDAGIRRMRIQMYGQMSPRFLLMLQMGMNNQSFASGGGTGTGPNGVGKKAPFFIHDAYGQFNLTPDKDPITKEDRRFSQSVGVGLHSWNGVSRLTNASTITLLTADAPIFNWPTVEIADQFTRQFGLFTKGHLGKLAYRLSINKPFLTAAIPAVGGAAVDNNRGNQLAYNGYFAWQFLDREEIPNAFYAGSYYGKRRVLNIGAGFMHNPNGTMSQPERGQFVSHDMTALGADVFYDTPVGAPEKDMSVTLYGVVYRYDFGPGYLRTTGIMNPGTADTTYRGPRAIEGYGNGRVLMGTGTMVYAQSAFMLPRFSSQVRVQPYLSYSYKALAALDQPGKYVNVGANFLFDGNRAKVAVEYASRPLYGLTDRRIFTHAGELLASIQFWL